MEDHTTDTMNQRFTLNLQQLQTLIANAHQIQSFLPRDPLENPYYIHPSEQSGINPISFVLTPSNFHAWERAMKLALKSKNKLKFVDGTIMKPESTDSSYAAWVRAFLDKSLSVT